jgi:predicted dehydrogenase
MSERTFGIGLIGVGGFGRFSIDAYRAVPGLRLIAVADADAQRAAQAAQECGTRIETIAEMLRDPAIDLVHITTLPTLHAEQAIAALEAGKHVFCEKPLATTEADARAIVAAARKYDRRVTVDYVLRHHPLWQVAQEIVQRGFFGRVRRWNQDNFASDERLPPGHWFWDRAISGGIFVEHAVHFFDLCNQLVPAAARKITAHTTSRASGQQDRVVATIEYGDGTLATFYHSFERPDYLERSSVWIGMERGYLTITGWIPEALAIDGVIDPGRLHEFQELVGAEVEVIDQRDLAVVSFSGAFKPIDGELVRVQVQRCDRMADYQAGIAAGLHEFVRLIADAAFQPRVSVQDGLASLRLALHATEAANGGVVNL